MFRGGQPDAIFYPVKIRNGFCKIQDQIIRLPLFQITEYFFAAFQIEHIRKKAIGGDAVYRFAIHGKRRLVQRDKRRIDAFSHF